MKKNTLTIFLFTIVVSAFGQVIDHRLEGVEKEIEQWMKTYNSVGLSVAVVEGSNVIYNKGFGYRNLENKSPVNENTVFPIASCSKAFTASLLGILEEENKLSLNDKPSLHIPSLEFYSIEMNNSIIITDLLSHKTGLGAINGTLVLFPENNRLKVLKKLKYIRPEGKVKESSIYSNIGLTIAGSIVEEVTKNSWEDNIQKRIFKPLEMNNSFTDLKSALETQNFSFGYGLFQNEIQKVQFEEYMNYKPAGGIRSTSKDLANWMIAWLNNGEFKNAKVLPENFVNNARRLHNSRSNKYEPSVFLQGYGLGWRVESSDGEFKVYHGGNTSGFSIVLMTFPFKNLGITVLVNQDDSILPYIIADIIKNRILNKERVDNYPVVVHEIYQTSKLKESLNNEQPPTHPLESFVGEYDHKGYGKIKIVLENSKLYAIYPTYKFFLQHLHHDIFVMKPLKNISDIFNPEFAVNFRMNNRGELSSLTMNLQSQPVEFIKQSN